MRMQGRVLAVLGAILFAAAVVALDGAATIDRYHRITDRVAIGGQPTPGQVTALSDDGFNGVINLREEVEFNDGPQARAARDSGLLFIRVPLSREKPDDAAVEKFLVATDDQAVYPVFIYCASGDRAAALWMIRRVVRDGWTLANAEAEADRAGLPQGKMRDFAHDYILRHGGGASGNAS